MIWLSWRQLRLSVLVTGGAVSCLLLALVLTGPGLLDDYRADPRTFLSVLQFRRSSQLLYTVGLSAVYAVPALIGAFWGAPLVARELESGTHRLVWNQSISRSRWLAGKLLVTGLAAVTVTALLVLAVSWWSSPIDRAVDGGSGVGPFYRARITPLLFAARGVVPIGYTTFALALGVAVGLVLRRTVPAIAVTLFLVVAVQVAVPLELRAHLVPADRAVVAITAQNLKGLIVQGDPGSGGEGLVRNLLVRTGGPGDWVTANVTVDAAGTVQSTLPGWVAACGGEPPGSQADPPEVQQARQACFSRLDAAGYRQLVRSQPADNFWELQRRETGLLIALALLLTIFCFRRIAA